MLQLGIISIQVNKLESDPKTDRTNSTTKGREEAVSKKVGSMEMWLRGETHHRCCRGEGAMVMEKGKKEREWSTQECTRRTFP